MATYEYDEAGVMATYFLITFLALILVPLTLSSLTKKSKSDKPLSGCQCSACIKQRKLVKQSGRRWLPRIRKRTYLLIFGWSLLANICLWVSNVKIDSKLYDPFQILGISSSASEKEIKSHYKKLSLVFHPDKVKSSMNLTLEQIQDKFVDITKAYKSLTDPVIRENWLKYNNPDGAQRMSMGIALPKWVIEGQNNIWVLGFYGLVFGGALPILVGRWWFGSRKKTKDGVQARSAATFFKSINEESSIEDIFATLCKAFEYEIPGKIVPDPALDKVEKEIETLVGVKKWAQVKKLAEKPNKTLDLKCTKALVVIYAHLLRIEITDAALRKDKTHILLQTPTLLNALLITTLSRNWLSPSLIIMRFHANLIQALPLNADNRMRLTQLPHVNSDEVHNAVIKGIVIDRFVRDLEDKGDNRIEDIRKSMSNWGRIEIVEVAFKVIGERIVSPSAITYFVLKLRLTPPGLNKERQDLSVDEAKRVIKYNELKDEEFLLGKFEMEELTSTMLTVGGAHAPYWPAERKPSWWVVIADEKTNRVVVPPFKVTDIPICQPEVDRDFRSYRIQFQSPPTTGVFTWKLRLISDTFAGEETSEDITLKIEEPTVSDEPLEDDISDPDEDTLAGQMAAMRGGSVKKSIGEESDDESSTDEEVVTMAANDSSSDSD